jgi:diguanylate cyclase (GGDEF)-like protein/putative nucleotidyltransferase with HDIG domain
MRVLACLVAAAIGVAFAAFALVGVVSRVTQVRSDQERAQRLADFGTLSYLVGRESRLAHDRRTDPATAATIRDLLTRLERSSSSAVETARVVTPAVKAVALAEHGHELQAAAAYARVRDAAQRAALQEATAQRGERASIASRIEDWSALAAAVLGSLLGLGLLAQPVRTPSRETDERVEQLSLQARTDSLTGLGNHRAFHETLSEAIAERAASNTPFVLLAIDLDGLKQINDTGGHLAGDTHIKTVADSLRTVVGDQGTVHRTGGDEFMVVLPGRRNWDGLAVARQIEEHARLAIGRRALSIGLTESTGTEGRHLLVGQADLALYEAKRTRLNAVVFNAGLAKLTRATGQKADGPYPEQRALAAALARAVDAKDVGTQSHCETVSQLCVAIGERLGVRGPDLERLRLAGLLHDVGKIGVADAILQKPTELDQAERDAMMSHVDIGHSILLAAELPIEAEWILFHHERFDGTGYPEERRGSDIPLGSRIVSVADAFEAMIADRPYRPSMPVEAAIDELHRHSGTQFDGRCVHALIAAITDTDGSEAALTAPEPLDTRPAAPRLVHSAPAARVA